MSRNYTKIKGSWTAAVIALLMPIMFIGITTAVHGAESDDPGFGYIDREGKPVITQQYDFAEGFSEGRGLVYNGTLNYMGTPYGDDELEGLFGYVDEKGKMVIPMIYESAGSFNGEIAAVKKDGKYGAIDLDGNVILDFQYDYLKYDKWLDSFITFKGTMEGSNTTGEGKYQVLSRDGKVIFEGEFDNLWSMREGGYEAKKDGLEALLDEQGNFLTDYEYEYIGAENEGMVSFRKDSLYGFMDTSGNIVIEAKYDDAGNFNGGNAVVRKTDQTYCIIDEKGREKACKADYIYEYVYNEKGITYAYEKKTSSGNEDSKFDNYYLLDMASGEYITKAIVGENAEMPTDYGIWWVKTTDGWTAFDLSGNVVIPAVGYESIETCGDLFVVKKNGKYGLINAKGEVLSDCIWGRFRGSDDGFISVANEPSAFESLVNLISMMQEEEKTPDMRSIRWGMSEDQVISAEGREPDYSGITTDNGVPYIGYDSTLMGNSVLLAYYFAPEGLYEARYIWQERHTADSKYITDYENVRTQLTNKYGEPITDDEDWDTEQHKNWYSEEKDKGLSYGYLTFSTLFANDRTLIYMMARSKAGT